MASNQWKLKLFGDLCSSVDGVQIGPFGSQLHASDYVESGIPVVMPKDMINTEISTDSIAYVSEEIANRLSKHRLKAGDLVFARRGDIGRFVIVSSEQTGWLCGTGCIRARFKPNIYPEFISLILQSHSVQYWLKSNAVGQTMLNLNTEIILNLPIRIIDSLESQITLANCIGHWDKAIAITEKLITAKRRLKQELIRKSLENSFWSASLLNSKFDEEEWKIKSLSSYFTERIETSSDIDKYPLFSLTIENGIVEKTDRYNREFLLKNRAENQYRVVHTGDFVFNPMNLRFGAIAISNIPHPVVVSAYYNVLIPNHKLIDNNFMIEILKSKRMIQVYNNIGKGSLVEKKRVHLKDFMKIKVPIPSLEQQKRIAYTISFLSEEETLLTRKLKLFQTQKQGLMQQLLTGKIRIQTP